MPSKYQVLQHALIEHPVYVYVCIPRERECCETLTFGKSQQRIYGDSLYYIFNLFCLKIFKSKKWP